jgi:two-component system, cell cycle response regulator DivK
MSEQPWILLVEDNEANRMLACAVLEGDGLNVRWVGTAQAARELLANEHPALVLMDVQLPDMDGLSLTRQLKADLATSSIPVVAVTAHAMDGFREIAIAAGCVGYISKPINVALFSATVRGYMSNPERPKAGALAARGGL